MKMLSRPINANKVKDIQIVQYANFIHVKGTCPKVDDGGTINALLKISNIGDFLTSKITGTFTSIVEDPNNAGNPADDGTNHLSVKITDTGNSIELTDTHIPMDLFLTPGRVRKMGVNVDAAGAGIAPDPSQPLFWPVNMEYIFAANTEINFEFKNDSDWANDFAICLHGTRIRSRISNSGI